MSGHLSHRLTNIHRAVSIALLYSVGSYAALVSSAQAATIGKTVVTSAQHEPLIASIAVSDIRAADFSASLANSTIYQQMGLTETDSMSVRFQPTSATSGQVFITTSQPVSKPFADVVLTLNDKGQHNVVPKTLLMPLRDNVPTEVPKNTVTGAKKPNLPSISASIAEPLTVRKGAPPPLISTPRVSTTELVASRLPAPNMQLPTVGTAAQGTNLSYAPSRLDNGRLSNSVETNNANTNDNQPNSASRLDNGRLGADKNVTTIGTNNSDINENKNTSITTLADKKFDILNIQITRQIQPSSKPINTIMTAVPMAPASNDNKTNVSTPDLTTSSNIATAAPITNIPANIVAPASPNTNVASSASNNTATSTAAAQYQVQRNDSLWVIAQQIALENNLDVQNVMKQIQSQNPDAFINKDADQLKADAKLSLPSYAVVPSQQKLEAAISAQRQYNRRANTPVIKKTAKTPAKKTAEKSQAAKQRKKPMITKTQTLPKAQFSVLAPGHNGSADGTQAKSASATGNGLSTDVLATLKASRENAVLQAQRLSKTSSALDSYTKKIQLQNQKLAELQARLKKLRNQ